MLQSERAEAGASGQKGAQSLKEESGPQLIHASMPNDSAIAAIAYWVRCLQEEI